MARPGFTKGGEKNKGRDYDVNLQLVSTAIQHIDTSYYVHCFFFVYRRPLRSTNVYVYFFLLIPGVHKIIKYVNRTVFYGSLSPALGWQFFFFFLFSHTSLCVTFYFLSSHYRWRTGHTGPRSHTPPSLVLLLAVTIPSTPFSLSLFFGTTSPHCCP